MDEIRKVNVHYRYAELIGGPDDAPTLEEKLKEAMTTSLGQDVRERILLISDEDRHKGCLHYTETQPACFIADIMHLDGRQSLPTWVIPTKPQPMSKFANKSLEPGEASIGEPAYIYVKGNNVAVIERLAFRNTNLARYLNELFRKAGLLEGAAYWKLTPKIQIKSTMALADGVKRIVVKPKAALGGEAPSEAPADANKRRARRIASAVEDFIAQGAQIVSVLKAIGVDQAKVDELTELMSSDLVIRAKVELTVASIRKKTTATLSESDVQQAFAHLVADGDVTIVSEDGTKKGKLVQLSHQAEVAEKDGLIDWEKAVLALTAAMSTWAAKGAIELE